MAANKIYSRFLHSLINFFKSTFIVSLCISTSFMQSSSDAAITYSPSPGTDINWEHVLDLNEDFRILWTIINQDITFEIQARTLGYVGLGFSLDGTQENADMAIGWVDKGHTYFQVF